MLLCKLLQVAVDKECPRAHCPEGRGQVSSRMWEANNHSQTCGGCFLLIKFEFRFMNCESSLACYRDNFLAVPLSLTPWGFFHILWLQTVTEALCKFA